MTVGQLLVVAATLLAAGVVWGPRAARTWVALTVVAAVASCGACGRVLFHGELWEWRSSFVLAGDRLHLRLDAISAFFLGLLSFVGASAAVYSREYWSDRAYRHSAPRNRRWWNVLLLSMGLVLVAANGLQFLIAWELFAVSSYFLITLQRMRGDVRAAGWLYLAASHAGTLGLFAFFGLLAARTGGWDLGPVREQAALAPLFWVALFGFGVKAGVFPLYIWLPSAHANAPSHVSAILSAVALKMGIYGIVRFGGWLPVPAAAGWVVLALGAIGAVVGIAFALAQTDLKRLLAYSSVENIGIILVGLGLALLAVTHGDAPWGRLALAGALLHVWNHGAFKSLLFFGAGSVLHATGTREMSRLGGLWRVMPWTAALFALGALAVCALPPLNGFVSEWLIYLGLFHAVSSRLVVAWAALPAAILLGATGALALAAFVKAAGALFAGAPRTASTRHAHECGGWMRGPMLLAAAVCVVLGLAPLVVWPVIERTVTAWHPAWQPTGQPAPVATLGWIPAAVAALLIVAVVGLSGLVRRRGARPSATWDCGYAQPTARMQYTAGSFSAIAAGWFAWLLQPERQLRRVRGVFPRDALRTERVPETILERVIAPVGTVVLQLSTAVRRLQHGRLQYYVGYVVIGLLALTALVATAAPS